MSRFDMKVPDVGEGVAEAELVEWMVGIGDQVTPDTVIAEVLTDKATVEISAPVTGEVVALHGEPGDLLAVGGDLIGFETEQEIDDTAATEPTKPPAPQAAEPEKPRQAPKPKPSGERPIAAPAVRTRAKELGVDLGAIRGSGPDGRVMHEDLDRAVSGDADAIDLRAASSLKPADAEGRTTPVRGVRRRIAERLTDAWRTIPHITYVDDIDMTELERLRADLNQQSDHRGVRLTILPFLARAMVIALADQPGINAHYDHASEMLTTFEAVHIGIATQTDDGLRVPVVHHSEARGVWGLAAEIGRVTSAARDGSATRNDLTGSTISITSLGALGGVATTPIINPPEVAIVGVNKLETRPVWSDGAFQPRKMMNLSSSFDHRMVDGWDAAIFIQRVKRVLETPALLFDTDS
ncbi:MAG: dihydrolipoamide acetyltransferase family protein [Acidimicrobiia bacterium]